MSKEAAIMLWLQLSIADQLAIARHACRNLVRRYEKTKKMEKIQERGLRFVYGDYTSDYDSLLCKSKMPSLKLGRERNIAIQTYKIKNNLAPRYLKELITPIQNSKFHLPLFKSTRHGLNLFAYMAPRIWNTLPECTRNATSLQNFKSRINKWPGIHRSQHKCANCIK